MARYDSLPKPIRDALKAAPFDYSPSDIMAVLRKTGLSPERFAAEVMPVVFERDKKRLKL